LVFEGGGTSRLEAASRDCSTNDTGWTGNMAFRAVVAGGPHSIAHLALVDSDLNQPDRSGHETVYADR
jgi:hypothetical protein